MDPYNTWEEAELARKRARDARAEAEEHEYEKEQAERRARDAERRRKEEATAAREELSYREEECSNLRGDLEDARSDTRREKERVSALVNAARAFVHEVLHYLDAVKATNVNGEVFQSLDALKELCDAARPRPTE